MQNEELIKTLVKGSADMSCAIVGGIAEYVLTDINGDKWQLQINLADKHDVGETATFQVHYDRALILMRWIRRAVENETLIKLRK